MIPQRILLKTWPIFQSNDADTANQTISNNQTQWSYYGEANPTSYNFGPDGTSADFVLSAQTPSSEGLYLGHTNLGYYDGGWKTYMDKDGNFFLNGTNGSLDWNSGTDTLSIRGTVEATDGEIAGFTLKENELSSGDSIVINSGDSNNNAKILVGGNKIIENRNSLTDACGSCDPHLLLLVIYLLMQM